MSNKQVIKLSISPDYVEWGVWQSVREFLQNCKDSHDQGNVGGVRYNPSTCTLYIVNEGSRLQRSTLLMGGSIKANDDTQIGSHGEGYKVAMTALMRLGKDVSIINDDEIWTASIEHDDTFNADVVAITIEEALYTTVNPTGRMTVVIEGILPVEWADILGKTLFLQECPLMLKPCSEYLVTDTVQGAVYSSDIGSIISNSSGDLYVRGLYVGRLPRTGWSISFNLNELALNRDRDVADYSDISKAISKLLSSMGKDALVSHPLADFINENPLTDMLYDSYNSSIAATYAAAFTEEHGHNAVAYTSECSLRALESVGIEGVKVCWNAYWVLQRTFPSVEKVVEKAASQFTVAKAVKKATTASLDKAMSLFNSSHEMEQQNMDAMVVDFRGDVRSISVGTTLYIGRDTLDCMPSTIASIARHIVDRDDATYLLAKVVADYVDSE